MTSQPPLPAPPPRPPNKRSRRLAWLVLILTLGVPVALALSAPSGSGGCRNPVGAGGAVVSASGGVTVRDAGLSLEDDDCYWDYRNELYLDFDGPVFLSISGTDTGSPGRANDVEIDFATETVVLTTELTANRSSCEITIDIATADRLVGSFECDNLVAGEYGQESNGVVPKPDLPSSSLSGVFELAREA